MSVEIGANQAFDEICQFSGHTTAPEQGAWLVAHGMLSDPVAPYAVVTEHPWNMPGSESYIMQFAIESSRVTAQRFIAKACVKMPVLSSIEDWVARRTILRNNGVDVPHLHAVHRGVLIEEHIPYDFYTVFIAADKQRRLQLGEQFVETYKRVYELGFRPVGLHDVRTRGDDVVLIDFGSDLGGVQNTSYAYDVASIEDAARAELLRRAG